MIESEQSEAPAPNPTNVSPSAIKEGPSPEYARCRACRSQIFQGATVCPICKTYQIAVVRWLQHFAAVIAVLAVIGGASTYAITHLPDVRRVLWWRDRIEIVAFRSETSITAANVGDGAIILNAYAVHADTNGFSFNHHGAIEETVEAGSIIHHELSKGQGPGSYVGRGNDQQWAELLARLTDPRDCAVAVYFKPDDPFYKEVQALSQKTHNPVSTIQGSATITWYSVHSRRFFDTTIPVVGLVYVRDPCQPPEKD